MKIKGPVLIMFFFMFSTACKKLVQKQEENEAISIITDGTWIVESYTNSGGNLTASFSGYIFQFYENGTVIGSVGNIDTSGTWSANVTNYSITSNFPGAAAPLGRLNAIWQITNSSIDSVSATAVINDTTQYLTLYKQ
jgi:hypothetical protein